ncbi:PTS sugar transporter subunit IIA, partial [Escherichia coli]|nr:PTS sugar transporter subunit IIA [Escherichia coli]
VMKVIESYATIHQRKELQSALQWQLQTHMQKTTKYSLEEVEKPVLKELLTAETIQLKPSVSSWQESIEEAAAPLLKIVAIEKSYVEAMITSIAVS